MGLVPVRSIAQNQQILSSALAILNPTSRVPHKVTAPIRVVGIDLGTTNSTVAEIVWKPNEDLKIRCLELDQETASGLYTHNLVPSAVALFNGREWIGEGAKRLHTRAPEFGLELLKNLFLECKNDIGAKRTYHKAPEGYRSAADISGRVLAFLKDGAEQQGDLPITRFVVTVPASFQASQRIDTVKAATIAGMDLSGGDLLDEPVAAFLDYLVTNAEGLKGILSQPKNLLVFDFGGGTCDVAIFQAGRDSEKGSMRIFPLAVSRYHRLGGGDIDRAVLYDVLLPQLLKQNEVEAVELSFEDKKNFIEPALVGVAESLKVGLCNEIARLRAFGQYESADKGAIVKTQPGAHSCKIGERELRLQSPTLSAAQFEELLKPFLDTDLLYARETEYRLTCSVFAPLQDALDRSDISASEIDLCLMVGGSSLIPQMTDAIAKFFPKAKPLSFQDREAVQVAVARGAAAHALSLALYGTSIFQVASPDRISIRTLSGSYELIPKGAKLPFPKGDDWKETSDLVVPNTSLTSPVALRVEILAGGSSDERSLYIATWSIPAPVNKGDKVRLEYRMDENQVLHFRLRMADQPLSKAFESKLDNPLSNVVNPHETRMKIQAAEEELRTGVIPKERVPDKVVEIGQKYAEIQQTDKAVSYLKQALRMKNRPDGYILNLLGIYHGERGDFDSQEKCYREAAKAWRDGAPLFNLALSLSRRRKFAEAKSVIDERLSSYEPNGPSLTLAAQIQAGLGDQSGKSEILEKALNKFGPPHVLEDYALGWLQAAATMAGNKELASQAESERNKRKKGSVIPDNVEGLLPDVARIVATT